MRFGMLMALVVGCYAAPVPTARVRRGPAANAPLSPIGALPPACNAEPQAVALAGIKVPLPDACASAYSLAIASASRMELEFAGHRVVDLERINAEARTHTSIDGAEQTSAGRTFLQLAIDEQRALLEQLGLQTVLGSKLEIGAMHGMMAAQTVTVTFTLVRIPDGALAWRSRCSVNTGSAQTLEAAIENATRCALESATLW